MHRFVLFLLLALSVASAAPVPKEHRKQDEKSLIVGTWKPSDRNSAWFRFAADGTLETWNPPADNSPMKWTWTNLDPKSNPKRMTLTRVSDQQVYTCPYELTGDTMRFAFYSPNQELPPDFTKLAGDVRKLVREK